VSPQYITNLDTALKSILSKPILWWKINDNYKCIWR
jgi:hypothetical protein